MDSGLSPTLSRDISVVLCAYTEERWDDLVAAVRSIRNQSLAAQEIVVVIDNNPTLLARVRDSMPDVLAIESKGARGAGEARNSGVRAASGSIVAFLDDDAVADPDWLEHGADAFASDEVIGVGGRIEPAWDDAPPRWLAEEFYWTIGCTYPGLPTSRAPVRNLIATNMFVRRAAFLEIGGFRAGFGKTGARSGTEETDLCIRAGQKWPERIWLYDPAVAVIHRVPNARATPKYFVSRCYDEGVAKASIVTFVGWHDGLAAERAYAAHTLPRGLARGLGAALSGRDPHGLARSASIVVGLAATLAGYARGRRARAGAAQSALTASSINGSVGHEPAELDRNGTRGWNAVDRNGRPGRSSQSHAIQTAKEGVLVVGSGTHFISGVSHYTRYLATALAHSTPTSVILMRRLIPRNLYPGRARVGDTLTEERYPSDMPVFDGVDWYWIPTIVGALRFLRRRRPEAVVFQWWTGAVLHSYVLLALVARRLGARIIIEVHEIQDTGEAGLLPARTYVRRFGRWLMAMADGYLVHSEFDRAALANSFDVDQHHVRVVRHGPFSHYAVSESRPKRQAPSDAWNVFFFGTIRPYKGLEDLIVAFDRLAAEDRRWWLTVVGETWEDWTGPVDLIRTSTHRDRITLVNRYVSDAEASQWFAGADIVALPYRRSSASGPLHLTMEAGLPVVVTDVGGLGEATKDYQGAILVPAANPDALAEGLRAALGLRGRRFEDQGSWTRNAEAVLDVLKIIKAEPSMAHYDRGDDRERATTGCDGA
jgi:glycosyltransferase involved in cell wall biosynthesis